MYLSAKSEFYCKNIVENKYSEAYCGFMKLVVF